MQAPRGTLLPQVRCFYGRILQVLRPDTAEECLHLSSYGYVALIPHDEDEDTSEFGNIKFSPS